MNVSKCFSHIFCAAWLLSMSFFYASYAAVEKNSVGGDVVLEIAPRGSFDMARWDSVLGDIKRAAKKKGISNATINATLKTPAFIPSIVFSDKNQSEFKLTMSDYLTRVVNSRRVDNGKKMRNVYPTLLARTDAKYGVPPHVILAFWGMESNYGEYKAAHKLRDAFITLIYEGRRKTFFENQLIALMQIADKNALDITDIGGSWAGAMGHFQFIPTTLSAYGADGNGDGHIDVIHSVGDAMYSAGNYLSKLGWDKNEKIVRKVVLPADFDVSLLDGKTKNDLSTWSAMGVLNPDGTPLPAANMTAGLVADVDSIKSARADAIAAAVANEDFAAMDSDIAPQPVIEAYLTYPNFYRIKRWNNSNWYAIAIAELSDKLK